MSAIQRAIRSLVEDGELGPESAAKVMEEMMRGEATEAQIGAFLTALRMRGEKPEELGAMARAMREFAIRVDLSTNRPVIDIVGTGGDGANTFNISTVASIIVAGAGGYVAKHGNRSVTSRCGSADLLEMLGVRIEIGPEEVKRCVERARIGYMFAPAYHPAMRNVAAARRAIGIRTIFNVLGPITNPARVKVQLIGVYDPALVPKIVRVLSWLGVDRALVVHSLDGIDEISLSSDMIVAKLEYGKVEEGKLKPEELGLGRVKLLDITTKSPEENVEVALKILAGIYRRGDPRRVVAVANAATALFISGLAGDISEGVELAEQSIDSGAALRSLELLVETSGGDVRRFEGLKSKYT